MVALNFEKAWQLKKLLLNGLRKRGLIPMDFKEYPHAEMEILREEVRHLKNELLVYKAKCVAQRKLIDTLEQTIKDLNAIVH